MERPLTTGPMDRLNALEAIEKEIVTCLQNAGQALNEMGKDKPSQKQVDIHSSNFLKALNRVEVELSGHINYLTQVSTGQAHEGSSYAAQKTLQMAWHRLEHARAKVVELERNKNQVFAAAAARQQGLAAALARPGQGQGPSSVPSSTSTTTGGPGGGGMQMQMQPTTTHSHPPTS